MSFEWLLISFTNY